MAAGLYALDARAPVQRQGSPLPRRAIIALCRTAPSPEGRFQDELTDLPGYSRQRAEFGPADSRRRSPDRLTTLRNRTPVVFGPVRSALPSHLFAVLMDDDGHIIASGRLRRVAEPEGCEVIQFDAANIRLMSDRFRG